MIVLKHGGHLWRAVPGRSMVAWSVLDRAALVVRGRRVASWDPVDATEVPDRVREEALEFFTLS